MELIQNENRNTIELYSDDNLLLELGFIADEFVVIFHTNEPIIISENNCEELYNGLNKIMNNDYEFANPFSKKNSHQLKWFSDEYCDIENAFNRNMINYFILRRKKKLFKLFCYNPYFKENNIVKPSSLVVFSPAGNGSSSKNLETGRSLQDDMVSMYQELYNKKNIKLQRTMIK